jgi:phenylpropionate dioxygenase-like ring-hydroxylating dioxygenase large terminal subunit
MAELPRPGDFLTLDLLGEPLLVRNVGGEVNAYLNVCAHRHCRLTGQRRGHDERFRCQYHGWEYAADGRTGKIPEARCFRPFDRENARLVKFRTRRWGEMVFVSLAEDGPDLAGYLGGLAEQSADWFAPPFRHAWTWEAEYRANWKVVVENSLESYHIPCLHQKSFGVAPPEDTCRHELGERHTTFWTPETYSWVSKVQNFLVRSVGGRVTNTYTHHHLHPNLIFISMDVMRMAQLVLPASPTTTRHRVWVYTLKGARRNPWAWLVRAGLSRLVVKVARQILLEDAAIFPEIQAGLESSRFRGVIGTREERVYAFQSYLKKALSG